MQLVLHCYTAVLYEPISKLYKYTKIYLSDAWITLFFFCFFLCFFFRFFFFFFFFFFFGFFFFVYFFFFVFLFLQDTGIEKPDYKVNTTVPYCFRMFLSELIL